VLAAPDLDKKMRMEVDVSDYATGGMLSMKCKDGKWRPVTFLSNVKIVDGGLYFIFPFHFYFTFLFFFLFNFLFLEQLGLGFISHAVTSVTN